MTTTPDVDARSRSRPFRLAAAAIHACRAASAFAWFSWSKSPGNWYLSLVPAGILPPDPESPAWFSSHLADHVRTSVITNSVCLAAYGGDELSLRSKSRSWRLWPPPARARALELPPDLRAALTLEEQRSAAVIADALRSSAFVTTHAWVDSLVTDDVVAFSLRVAGYADAPETLALVSPFGDPLDPRPVSIFAVQVLRPPGAVPTTYAACGAHPAVIKYLANRHPG